MVNFIVFVIFASLTPLSRTSATATVITYQNIVYITQTLILNIVELTESLLAVKMNHNT